MRRGALLLEVIVALVILTAALGLLGAELVAGLRMTAFADEQARANQLAERMISVLEMDPNAVLKLSDEAEIHDRFGDAFPGWHWRVRLDTTDLEGLARVTLQILYQSDAENLDAIDGARVLREYYMLRAAPPRVDLAKDFGVPQDQVDELSQVLPLVGLDATAFNPQALAQMITPETLPTLLPILMPLLQQLAGGALPEDMSPEDLMQMLLSGQAPPGGEALQGLEGLLSGGDGQAGGRDRSGGGAGGVDRESLRQMLRSQLGSDVTDEEIDALLDQMGSQGGSNQP